MMSGSSLFGTYIRAPFEVERGEGCWLISVEGERYLDFSGGVAVNSLGHCHPHLVQALTEQATRVWHTSNLYRIPGQDRLAERLCAHSFAERVFFTNSGAEALECSIKTARRYHYARGDADRFEIITFEGAFHGRTIATIAAGGQEKYLEGFGPKAPGFTQLPFIDLDRLRATISNKTAAVLIEPVQGEGGIRLLDPETLRQLRTICDETGALLVLDEVQCGVGRTGRFFAHEWADIQPDIMAVAKGIGGGFPLGACLATEEAAAGMVAGSHGTTFGGNPLAMAVGNAVLDIVLEDGFMEEVTRKSLLLKQGLASIVDDFTDIVSEVRGMGLMTGIRCAKPNAEVTAALRKQKLLAVPAGDNVVRFLPPLTVTDDEIRLAIDKLREACNDMSNA